MILREKLFLKSLDVMDETTKHPGSEQNVGRNTCHMAVKKVKQPRVGTQGPMKNPARDRDPRTREKEHGQQQADEVLLRIPKQPSATEQRERESCADVPEDVPQSENVDEFLPKVQEGRGCMHARSNVEVTAEHQCDSEAQGPEHDGAYFEQAICFR